MLEMSPLRCPVCGKGYSADCIACRARSTRMSAMKIIGDFPWGTHSLVWDDSRCAGMHCELCGLKILPEMTMREVTGPCSGRPALEDV